MKKIVIIFGLICSVLLVAGCTIDVKTDQPLQPTASLEGRRENSGFQKKDISGNSYSVLQANVDAAIPETDLGADLGAASYRWGTIYGSVVSLAGSVLETLNITKSDYTVTTSINADSVSAFGSQTSNHSLTSAGSLIVAGLEVNDSAWFDGTTTTIDNLVAGTLELPLNGGLIDLVNIPVSSAAGDTVKQGYTFNVDGFAALSLLAKDSSNDGNASSTVLEIRAGKSEKARYVEAATTFAVGDYHINASTTAAAFTVTLSSAFIAQGTATLNSVGVISDTGGSAGTNNITIATQGAETINGASTYTISGNYNSVHIKCNGTSCYVF